ncbi:unnamed protein product, partial [marine sediment metagenome]
SNDPQQMASIRVQDIYKFIGVALIILGIITVNLGNDFFSILLLSES